MHAALQRSSSSCEARPSSIRATRPSTFSLFNLGVATATVRDPMLWGLDGVYLEACIRENPGTAIAARCFSVLLDRTVFGFTGSSGTVLPSDVDSRLQTLAKLAAPSRK
jgi:hypothetical protein